MRNNFIVHAINRIRELSGSVTPGENRKRSRISYTENRTAIRALVSKTQERGLGVAEEVAPDRDLERWPLDDGVDIAIAETVAAFAWNQLDALVRTPVDTELTVRIFIGKHVGRGAKAGREPVAGTKGCEAAGNAGTKWEFRVEAYNTFLVEEDLSIIEILNVSVRQRRG